MTMSVQAECNHVGPSLIGFDWPADAMPNAAAEAPPVDSGRRAAGQSGLARGGLRMRRARGKESIDPSTVAARLNRLFDTIRPPGRGPLRNYEVIRALRARGIEISAPYLSQLRAGRRSHPSLAMLRPLADFFGVSVDYFTDADSAYSRYLEAELCWLEMAHDPRVREITTALLALPPDVREDTLTMRNWPTGDPAAR